ncbi:MAG TPA: hypothetical protein VJ853_09265, partial [Thermoanaerobaculia bacterium]|nr:hypothetical protein [Thermoanaerobaculia bacterium]
AIDAKSGATSATTATSSGTFSTIVATAAGHRIDVKATDNANRSSTRTIGAVPFVTTQRNDAAVIAGDSAFRARRVAADGLNWIATNGTVDGAHMNGGSSRALLFRQPDASSPPAITAFDTTVGTVEDVALQGAFAYVTGDRFATIDIVAATPTIQLTTSRPCGRELALVVAGNFAFGAESGCANNGTIDIYDVSNPAAPLYVRQQAVGGATTINYRALLAYGTQYLIAITPDKPGGAGRDVTVIDRSDTNNLRKIAELDVPAFDAVSGLIDGTTLYLAGGDSGIAIVDLSNPAAPAWISTTDAPCIARSIVVTRPNEIAVADAGGPGLTFLDTSDRMRPIVLGSQPFDGNANDVKLSGGRLFVATETRSYVVIRP